MNTTLEKTPILFAGTLRLKPKEAQAVEALGALNDRHTRALAAGDAQALVEVAGDYLLIGRHGGCPKLAREVMAEADGLCVGQM